MSEIIDWNEHWQCVAALISLRGTCTRKKVGAVIVDKNNRFVSAGYNGSPHGIEHCLDSKCLVRESSNGPKHCIRTIHAERNSLYQAGDRARDCTQHSTVLPCETCFRDIIQQGISEVHYIEDYNRQDLDYWILQGVIKVKQVFPKSALAKDILGIVKKSKVMDRMPWDDYFMCVTSLFSLRGTCPQKQVGTLIVDPSHHIVSAGYNGAPHGVEHCADVGCLLVESNGKSYCKRSTPAEVNALLSAGERSKGCTMYSTAPPYQDCFKDAMQQGITKIVHCKDINQEELEYWIKHGSVTLERWQASSELAGEVMKIISMYSNESNKDLGDLSRVMSE